MAGGKPGGAGKLAAGVGAVELPAAGAGVPKWRTTRLQVDWASAPPPPAAVDLKGLASRLMAPPRDESLPGLDALVVVEGFNDCLALHRAVRAPVYVMGGGGALADAMSPELRYLWQLASAGVLPRQLVVFTDPDWQGRTYRTLLDDELRVAAGKAAVAAAKAAAKVGAGTGKGAAGAAAAKGPVVGGSVGADAAVLRPGARRLLKPAAAAGQGSEAKQETALPAAAPAAAASAPGGEVVVRHAFLRVELATSEVDSGRHEAGNVGVEHATPDVIRSCLRRARPGFGPGRSEFTAEGLQADGLIGVWNDKAKVAGPGLRRGRFCRALGIDEVGSGKALANLLNRYFTRDDYAAALEACQLPQGAAHQEVEAQA
ncbi:hypothetical protein HYH02_003946 [Chlamydomonas schloesseri]|uniref:Ribonuclease M5 C-terminal domain-containing protein n=1 Tax=Chlamydomonas schloesseri TaxID=2026947 RepID=A0A836B911_9CHLO|nr:hypothetical protein HYH02_003946 [Chlamydomonas schloesseri]|eukprot:KAG2451342.1 hypothetical protein HYH02_003946 [Chlamydomonas schloesseri]